MKPLHLLVTLSLFISQPAFAGKGGWWGPKDLEEVSGFGILNRLEIGYTMPITKPIFTVGYVITNTEDPAHPKVDRLKNELKLNAEGWGATAGFNYPLWRFGNGNALSLHTGLLFNMYTFTGDATLGINDPNSAANEIHFTGWHAGSPAGIDFKHGADAIYKKNPFRTSVTLGAGVYPHVTHLEKKYGIVPDYLPQMRPYFKAEFGVLGGMMFKIRMLVTGKAIYYNRSESLESGTTKAETTFDISAPAEVNFSLIIQPFATSWQKY